MKKRWLKKALCAGLALSMIVGLSACGGGGDKNVNAALAKENVYRLTEVEIPQFVEADNEGYVNVMDTVHKDGKIYVLLQVQHCAPGQSSQEIKMMTMNDDGSDVQVTEIEPSRYGSGG